MTTPHESAQILLRLYELRREAKLREARDWFLLRFHPQSADEVVAVLTGEHSAKYRMVVGYWDMAASFVTHGAVDPQMFRDASPELLPTCAKIQPYLAEVRSRFGVSEYLKHLEDVALSFPDAQPRMANYRQQLQAAAAGRDDG